MYHHVIGLDIGGANLKAAHTNGVARVQPFAVWKTPQELPKALQQLLARLPSADLLAVTMTAELCDCYATKREGVHAILDAVEAQRHQHVMVWQNDGGFATLAQARREVYKTAAANWLAVGTFAARFCPAKGPALVVDIGSTTTDIVPIRNGIPVPQGRTDTERMAAHELLYMGVRRTPLCALFGLKNEFAWRERRVPPAAELFATTQDAYQVLGDLPEDHTNRDTADGRPATKRHAHARLARMLCLDTDSFKWDDALAMSQEVRDCQVAAILQATRSFQPPRQRKPQTIVVAGAGEFLARLAYRSGPHLKARLVSLAEKIGPRVSQAACAYAVAVLAAERLKS